MNVCNNCIFHHFLQFVKCSIMPMKVKFTQPCPTLYDPTDSVVHGILQARILEWVAFPFSRGSWNPGIKPTSPALQADSLPAEPQGKPIVPLDKDFMHLFSKHALSE